MMLLYHEFIIRDWHKSDRNPAANVIQSVLAEYGLGWEPDSADRDVLLVEEYYLEKRGEFWVIEYQNKVVLLLNRPNLLNEKRWKKEASVSDGASIPLVVEVVSTNWRDDYHFKFADYEEMGISEYWIADYAALGGKKFIGDPKQLTFLVCKLVEDEYQVTKFTGNDLIISPIFPNLKLSVQQIFDSAL